MPRTLHTGPSVSANRHISLTGAGSAKHSVGYSLFRSQSNCGCFLVGYSLCWPCVSQPQLVVVSWSDIRCVGLVFHSHNLCLFLGRIFDVLALCFKAKATVFVSWSDIGCGGVVSQPQLVFVSWSDIGCGGLVFHSHNLCLFLGRILAVVALCFTATTCACFVVGYWLWWPCVSQPQQRVFVSWSPTVPSTCPVDLRDGSVQTLVRAATLQWKLHLNTEDLPDFSKLTLGRSVLAQPPHKPRGEHPLKCQERAVSVLTSGCDGKNMVSKLTSGV